MRNPIRLPVTLMTAATAGCFALAACTSETQPDTEVATEETENLPVTAPGLQTVPESGGAKSADTDQPRIGADSVQGELGSPVADPGQPIQGDTTVRGNQGAANQ